MVLAYCTSFEAAVSGGVQNYITAYFGVTSLTALLPTIMAALSTALVPLYTKVSDVFGRAGSLTFAFTSYLLGLIIAGSAHSYAHLGVGEIVNGIGATGINTLSQVVIAGKTNIERNWTSKMHRKLNTVFRSGAVGLAPLVYLVLPFSI